MRGMADDPPIISMGTGHIEASSNAVRNQSPGSDVNLNAHGHAGTSIALGAYSTPNAKPGPSEVPLWVEGPLWLRGA
jgi:hypothetical protein